MKHSLFIVFLLFSLSGFSQTSYDSTKLSPLVRKVVRQLDAIPNNYLINNNADYLNQLKLLRQRSKVHELIQLVNHPNPFIRVNAFNYLLDSAYSKFIDIIEQHITDTATIYLQSGDVVTITNVIEGMLHFISWNNNWVGMFEFTDSDNKRLASLSDRYWSSKKSN
jgi:hypothetical protein